MGRPKKKVEEEGAPAYMVQYCDMVTQLVTFFIILLTMAHERVSGFRAGMGSVRDYLGSAGAVGTMPTLKGPDVLTNQRPTYPIAKKKSGDVVEFAKRVFGVDQGELSDIIEVRYKQSTVSIRIPEDALFEPGKAELKPDSLAYLDRIIYVFRDQPHLIIVSGHTDQGAGDSEQGMSDWELSARRANCVVRYLHDTGGISYDRLSGLGHGRYRPLVPAGASKGNAANRRIEIMITKPGRDKWTR